MTSSESEGLGLSVLIYMTAILTCLALMAVPAYLLTRGQVYENPSLVRADPLLNGPVIGQRESSPPPLGILKHRTLVDPDFVASLNAKIEQPKQHRVTQKVAKRERRQTFAELPDEPRRPTFFLFRLFGG